MHKSFDVYEGPYVVKKKIAEDTYIIITDDGKEKYQFHMKNIKPYFGKDCNQNLNVIRILIQLKFCNKNKIKWKNIKNSKFQAHTKKKN